MEPEVVLCLQRLPGSVSQEDDAHPRIAKHGQTFFSAQQKQLLP